MSKPLVPTAHATLPAAHALQPAVTPPQVWSTLAADLQHRAICLLVQLAYNQMTAQAEVAVAVKVEELAPTGSGCTRCDVPPEAPFQEAASPATPGGSS